MVMRTVHTISAIAHLVNDVRHMDRRGQLSSDRNLAISRVNDGQVPHETQDDRVAHTLSDYLAMPGFNQDGNGIYIGDVSKRPIFFESNQPSILYYANPGIVEGNWVAANGMAPVGWLPGTNRFETWAGHTPEEIANSKEYWAGYVGAHHILLDAMIEAGVTVLAGTDTGMWLVVPGFALHDELETLQTRGMTPAQALRTATSAPAHRIRNNAGIIEIGRRADLLLLNKNPLDDVANTRSIETVILDGEVLERPQLDAILNSVKRANEESRKVDISAYQ